MTMKHVIDGLMKATESKTHSELARATGLSVTTISHLSHGKQHDVAFGTLAEAQKRCGVPITLIYAWYLLPANALASRLALMGMAA